MKMRSQLFDGNLSIREIEEDDSENPVLTTSELLALATGDERLMTYVNITNALTLNENLLDSYRKEASQIANSERGSRLNICIPLLEQEIEYEKRMTSYVTSARNKAIESLADPSNIHFTIQGEDQNDIKAAGEKLWEIANRIAGEHYTPPSEPTVEQEGPTRIKRNRRGSSKQYSTEHFPFEIVGEVGLFQLGIQVALEKGPLFADHLTFNIELVDRDTKNRITMFMLKDPKDCVERIFETLEETAEKVHYAERRVAGYEADLVHARQTLARLEAKIIELEATVIQQNREKIQLELELDLNPESFETIECNDEGE